MNNPKILNLLHGKVAVITGANRGIGKAIADLFENQGATVIRCVRSLPETSNSEYVVELDLSNEDSVKSAVKQIRKISRQIDILINCAGIADGSTFQLTSLAKMRALFDVNVFNTLLFTQGLSRLMNHSNQPAIVNISSSTAQFVERGTLSYGTSKAALERSTLSLAVELGELGIRVNAIAPGVTDTDMAQQMSADAKQQLINKSILKKSATVTDIANTALFLCSHLASHITGQIIHVDGGIVN